MRRAASLLLVVVLAVAVVNVGARGQDRNTTFRAFNVVEASITDLQNAMQEGRLTSRELVLLYLQRIAQYEDRINAVAYVSRTALDEAEELDRERAAGHVRGPLHGIPIGIKDIINTSNMPTTGGAVAFEGIVPNYDAPVVANLKRAGAVMIAKTTLTELANWVTNGMPANYSGLFGFSMNPYDPRPDPRDGNNDGRPVMSTGGSSSGTGTAMSFWAGSVGTETSGSILSPSNQNMLVGIKPTVGLISRYGIIPITADQDTAGPMTRTVTDAAIMLSGMVGFDQNDPITNRCALPPGTDYTRFLRSAALRGARIGIPRANFYVATTRPDTGASIGGLNAAQTAVMNEAIQILRNQGATIIDPADIPSYTDRTPANNYAVWGTCSGLANARGLDTACSIVLKYGAKRDINAYLASLGPGAPFKTLTQLRQYNLANRWRNTLKFEQQNLDISDEMDIERDRARWQADRNKDIYLAATHGIDEAMAVNNLDALLFPANSGAGIGAKAGHPTVIVPFGFIPNQPAGIPAGFNPLDQPYGVGFTGTACSEGRLIELAYAFEQATKRRVPPPNAP
jgi:amidase